MDVICWRPERHHYELIAILQYAFVPQPELPFVTSTYPFSFYLSHLLRTSLARILKMIAYVMQSGSETLLGLYKIMRYDSSVCTYD